MVGVQQPYDIAIVVPELALTGIAPNDGDERWLQQFSDAARFEVYAQDGSPNFEADIYWGDERLGKLGYQFEERAGGNVRLNVQKREWGEHALFGICRNPDYLTIYFDTGHTFSRGHFYKTQFRDVRFVDWRWVNMAQNGIDIRREKPVDGRRFAAENIGEDDDISLFGLVARHWPDLEGRGAPTGWLVCDDGSMESADFIHLDNTSPNLHLTLIHVKGSHSVGADRGMSVSDYEVVVGQAVKNLRHIDRGLLIDKLETNKETQLRDAVWFNGERQHNRDGVLAALAAAGSKIEKTVVVLQPRVRPAHTMRFGPEWMPVTAQALTFVACCSLILSCWGLDLIALVWGRSSWSLQKTTADPVEPARRIPLTSLNALKGVTPAGP